MDRSPSSSPHRIADKKEIRRRLNRDRDWSLYALADLDHALFPSCEWWAQGEALALVFHALAIRPIFVIGDESSTRDLLTALSEPVGYLNLQAHQLVAAEGIYRYREAHQMHRMLLDRFQPRAGATAALSEPDQKEIELLYATGDGGGIAFAPFQLHTGLFRGIREGGELVAVAGVHVVSRGESVAAVGNIFTHPDCRGRGLAQVVTSAVVTRLREEGITTIGLNVEVSNSAAIAAYERLGFRTHLGYCEGTAERLFRTASLDPHWTPRP